MDPLDELLAEAGIPTDHPTRTLVERDGHRVVTDRASDDWRKRIRKARDDVIRGIIPGPTPTTLTADEIRAATRVPVPDGHAVMVGGPGHLTVTEARGEQLHIPVRCTPDCTLPREPDRPHMHRGTYQLKPLANGPWIYEYVGLT